MSTGARQAVFFHDFPDYRFIGVKFAYDPILIQAIKSQIAPRNRTYDPGLRAWGVVPAVLVTLQAILRDLGYSYSFDNAHGGMQAAGFSDTIRVNYIEDISGSRPVHWGIDEYGNRRYVFTQSAISDWVLYPEPGPLEAANYYEALGIPVGAGRDSIKRAYRETLKRWHPDVCADPRAADTTALLYRIWNTLGDEQMRRRYDYGLRLAGSGKKKDTPRIIPREWRCGYLTVSGIADSGFYRPDSVEVVRIVKIAEWQGIFNSAGQRMVAEADAQGRIHYNWI